MRITNNMMAQNTIRNINNSLIQMTKYQNQAASQKKIQVPSEDPVVAARSLKMQSYLSEITQQKKNADDASSWMDFSDNAMGQIGDSIQEIRELTVQAANDGTLTDDDKANIKTQIEQLKVGIVDIANSSYSGRYAFAGYNTDKAPFEIVSTSIGDMVTYNGKYLSLAGVVSSSVSDSDIQAFYEANLDKVCGQAELTSASVSDFTTDSSALSFDVTLDGVTKTISLTANKSYTLDTLVSDLQDSIDTAFPSTATYTTSSTSYSSGDAISSIKVGSNDGKLVLTVQEGSSISLKSGTLNVSQLGFTSGIASTQNSNEDIYYKLGADNKVAVNVEGSDMFGLGTDCLFDTLTKLEMSLDGDTSYKTAAYTSGTGVSVATITDSDTTDGTVNALETTDLLADLDKNINTLLVSRTDLGSRMKYVELTQNRLDDNYTTFSDLLSKNENADLAEVSMNLTNAQTVYSASLAAGAKIMQNSLLDYLR